MELEAISKTRVGDEVYERLLSNIHEGVWKSGEKLPSENALCQLLSVSRVSVRGAIQRLRTLGLVETRHGKGTYVSSNNNPDFVDLEQVLELSEKEFYELNMLREAIEPKAIQLIAEGRGKLNISHVEKAYHAMQTALLNHDEPEYTKQDYLFHMAIITACGNDIFVQVANIFRGQYYKYFREINKYMFVGSPTSDKFIKRCKSQYDSHALLYNYIVGELSENIYEIMQALIANNRTYFESYRAQLSSLSAPD